MKGDRALTSSLRSASTMAAVGSPQKVVSRRPLRPLPTGMLLRSLMIAGISSKRYLLLPSLKILSFLSSPNRGFLFNADKNPLIHAILKKTFYEQFCAGVDAFETKQCVQRLKDLGFRGIILTYARETVFDHSTKTKGVQGVDSKELADAAEPSFCSHIEDWRAGTAETVELINDGDYLAVK